MKIEKHVTTVENEDAEGRVTKKDYVTFVVEATALQAGVPTRNGHVYSDAVIRKAIEAYKATVQANRAFGVTVDNVQTYERASGVIPLRDVSHVVTDVRLEGRDLVVKAKTVDTPNGDVLKRLLQAALGVAHESSEPLLALVPAGMGSIRDDGTIGDDFIFTSFDFVPIEKTR